MMGAGEGGTVIQQPVRVIRYKCPVCGKTFTRRDPPSLTCLVIHPEGTCCHYGEEEDVQQQGH